MTIKDKKTQVLEMLKKTNDYSLIEEVYDLLHPAKAVTEINIQGMPEPLQHKINKAMEDYNAGNYITHEQMKQKLQQWLTK